MNAQSSYTEPRIRWTDNPIMIAQRQRRSSLAHSQSGLLMTTILCLLAVLITGTNAEAGNTEPWDTCFGVLLLFYGFLLLLKASNELSSLMAEERSSGMLEFHRASPTTTWTDALGYLIGGTAKEVLMAATTIPFILIASFKGSVGIGGGVAAIASVGVTSLLYHTFGMVLGLAAVKKKRAGGGVTGIVLLLLIFGSALYEAKIYFLAYLTPYPAMAALGVFGPDSQAAISNVSFFGLATHPVIFSLLLQGIVFFFAFWATTRRLSRDDKSAFSRVGATVFISIIALVNAGSSWDLIQTESGAGYFVAGANLIVLLVASCILISSVAPRLLYYVRAEQRRQRNKSGKISWKNDAGRIMPVVLIFFAIYIGTVLLVWMGLTQENQMASLLSQNGLFGLAMVLGCMCFFGLVNENARLAHASRSKSRVGLIYFLVLGVPWLVSLIFLKDGQTGAYVFAISPVYALITAPVLLLASLSTETPLLSDMTLPVISLCSCFGLSLYFWTQTNGFLKSQTSEPMTLPELKTDGDPESTS